MTHVTCRLTAKNRDQLRDPTFGNGVLATFTFLLFRVALLLTNTDATNMKETPGFSAPRAFPSSRLPLASLVVMTTDAVADAGNMGAL